MRYKSYFNILDEAMIIDVWIFFYTDYVKPPNNLYAYQR